MDEIYADTFYWIALIDSKDIWHKKAHGVSKTLKSIRLVTTDLVLVELLSFFAKGGQYLRQAAVDIVKKIRNNPNIYVVPQSQDLLDESIALFEKRIDKGYSLVDCASMIIMRRRGINRILTHDQHFKQEQFILLFQNA